MNKKQFIGLIIFIVTLCPITVFGESNNNLETIQTLESNNEGYTLGDINNDGKINTGDVLLGLRHIYATSNNKKQSWILIDNKFKAADVTKDNVVNSGDILKILRYISANSDPKVAQKHANWKRLDTTNNTDEPDDTENGNNSEKIRLSQNSITILKGKSQVLTAITTPLNQKVEWISLDKSIATVSNGNVKGVNKGKATIIARLVSDNNQVATCIVTVVDNKIEATGIDLLEKNGLTLEVGSSYTMNPIITPANATDTKIKWEVTDKNVLSISSGKVTAKGVGKASVIATLNQTGTDTSLKQARCEIEVKEKVGKIQIKDITINKGQTKNIEVIYTPENALIKDIEYEYDANYIKIDSNGQITGLKKTDNPIEVKAKSKSISKASTKFYVTVKVPATTITAIISGNEIKSRTLYVGQTFDVNFVESPSNSTDNISVSSSDKSVVTVSNKKTNANYKIVTIKAVKAGTAVITGKTSSGKIHEIKITVKNPTLKLKTQSITMKKNDTKELKPAVTQKGATYTIKSCKSSNTGIVTVTKAGKVTAKNSGTAIVTMQTTAGTIKYKITVK